MQDRTALLIRCSPSDAEQIRKRAAADYRTMSGYMLNILSRSLRLEQSFADSLPLNLRVASLPPDTHRKGERRTAVLLRCSTAEADRIRTAAKRRRTTIDRFVLHCMRRSWNLVDQPEATAD